MKAALAAAILAMATPALAQDTNAPTGAAPGNVVTKPYDDGGVYTGTFRGGLSVFDGNSWKVHMADQRIHCLLATPAGLWIGTPKGLVWTDGQSWQRFDGQQGLPGQAVWSLASRGDELWIGTDSGLCEARLSRLKALPLPGPGREPL